jgi:hypothetical protein
MWLTLMIKLRKIEGASPVPVASAVGALFPWIRRNRRR